MENEAKPRSKLPETVFFATVAAASMVAGFTSAIGRAKKQSPEEFAQGLAASKEIPESGTSLALRALRRGTLYAFGGVGLFCAVVWTALGVKDMKEFRQKVGGFLPNIPKKESEGRTEFESFRDLLQYCIDESEKSKKVK